MNLSCKFKDFRFQLAVRDERHVLFSSDWVFLQASYDTPKEARKAIDEAFAVCLRHETGIMKTVIYANLRELAQSMPVCDWGESLEQYGIRRKTMEKLENA